VAGGPLLCLFQGVSNLDSPPPPPNTSLSFVFPTFFYPLVEIQKKKKKLHKANLKGKNIFSPSPFFVFFLPTPFFFFFFLVLIISGYFKKTNVLLKFLLWF